MEQDNYFSVAIYSLQSNVNHFKGVGREDSPEWHLANGLLRLAQGLQQESRILEDRLEEIVKRLPPVR